MPTPVRIAVIIPAGPRDDIVDTLDSVVRYTDPVSRVIVVVDDTKGAHGDRGHIASPSPDIAVIDPVPARPGTDGGLWVKVAAAYRWVLQRYRPALIMRLDADALFLGPGIEAAAEAAFGQDPRVGLLGSYRVGPTGAPRDFAPVASELHAEIGPRGLRNPRLRTGLRHFTRLARQHGYEDGEHVLGCAYLHSFPAASRINANGWFDQPWLEASRLCDDQIMSLLTVAAGYRIADFGGPSGPLALKWQGLPAHPADLLATGKIVTHSVRSWGGLSEKEIRGIFAAARASAHLR
jgi:hypothetical protein